jgi:hypothetical protein
MEIIVAEILAVSGATRRSVAEEFNRQNPEFWMMFHHS